MAFNGTGLEQMGHLAVLGVADFNLAKRAGIVDPLFGVLGNLDLRGVPELLDFKGVPEVFD